MKPRGAFLCILPMLLVIALPAAPATGSPAALPAAAFSVAPPLHASPAPPRVAEACDGESQASAGAAPPRSAGHDPVAERAARWPARQVPASFGSPASSLIGRRNE
jgi:hypothetical protein